MNLHQTCSNTLRILIDYWLKFVKRLLANYCYKYKDRTQPMDKHFEVMVNKDGVVAAPITPQLFGNAGREHMKKYGEK